MFGIFGWIALILSHTLYLRSAPGFQNDEATLGLLIHRIATETGFWPSYGISNYTFAWIHYPTALLFRWIGPSLWLYRAVGVAETLAGIALISAALVRVGERRAARLLPWVIAFFPALVINHRWVVELTTIWVLWAGCVAYGLALRRAEGPSRAAAAWIVIGVFGGLASHVLFTAPALALWLCLFCHGRIVKTLDRWTVAACALVSLPIYALIFRSGEDPDRAAALMACAGAVLAISAAPPRWLKWLDPIRGWLLVAAAVVGSVLLIPQILFLEGNWLAMFSVGFLDWPVLRGLIFVPIVLVLGGLATARWRPRLPDFWQFYALSLLGIYCMVVKPGPRYLEIPFLVAAVGVAAGLARVKSDRVRAAAFGIWILQGSLVIGLNYLAPSVQERQIGRIFHLWRWRDGSEGFLPKLKVVSRLADAGCTVHDLEFSDTWTEVCLKFLALGDWPPVVTGGCQMGAPVWVYTARPDEPLTENASTGVYLQGPYVMRGKR